MSMKETLKRKTRLSECEAVIERAQRHVEEAGKALLEIKEQAYYVDSGFKSFEEYCLNKWDFSKGRASQLISSYRAIIMLESQEGQTTESFTTVNKTEDIYSGNKESGLTEIYNTLPSTREEREAKPREVYSERQLRPLSKIVNNDSIPAEKKQEIIKAVWKDAEHQAEQEGKSTPTGEMVQKAAERHCPEIITENPHPYRVVTYLSPKYRNLLDTRLGKRSEMTFEEQDLVAEKEADVVRRMVEYCLINNIKV